MEHKQKQNLPKSARSSQYNQYILLYPIIFVHLSKLKLLNRNNLFLCHLSLEGKGKKEIIAMFLEKKKNQNYHYFEGVHNFLVVILESHCWKWENGIFAKQKNGQIWNGLTAKQNYDMFNRT